MKYLLKSKTNRNVYIVMNILFVTLVVLYYAGIVILPLIMISAPLIFNFILITVSFWGEVYKMCGVIDDVTKHKPVNSSVRK